MSNYRSSKSWELPLRLKLVHAAVSPSILLSRVFTGEGEEQVHAEDKSYFPSVKTFALWSRKGWGNWARIKNVEIAFEGQIKASIPAADRTYNLFMSDIS